MEEKIIKARLAAEAGSAIAPASKLVVKKDVFEAGQEARTIIEAAEAQARAILAAAERTRTSVFDAARKDGYEQGLALWNDALVASQRARDAMASDYESELMRLSVKISEKIIGEELLTRPETILSIVREALHSIRHERSVTIQVNPQEVEEVRRQINRLQDVLGPGRQLQVVADSSVTRGGCLVESELGVIDARLETQLKCLEDALSRAARK
jgi:type III secretion system HrpE/YscL family protein